MRVNSCTGEKELEFTHTLEVQIVSNEPYIDVDDISALLSVSNITASVVHNGCTFEEFSVPPQKAVA